MAAFDRITSHPERMNGQPCVRDLRITGRRVLEALVTYSDREELVVNDPNAMLALKEAARLAGTSVRVVRDAIRACDLAGYGRQRDRSVRRGDLDAWITSRRMRPVPGADDRDIEARIARLARAAKAKP